MDVPKCKEDVKCILAICPRSIGFHGHLVRLYHNPFFCSSNILCREHTQRENPDFLVTHSAAVPFNMEEGNRSQGTWATTSCRKRWGNELSAMGSRKGHSTDNNVILYQWDLYWTSKCYKMINLCCLKLLNLW